MFMLRKLKAAGLNSQEYTGYTIIINIIRPLLEYVANYFLWHPGLTQRQVGVWNLILFLTLTAMLYNNEH